MDKEQNRTKHELAAKLTSTRKQLVKAKTKQPTSIQSTRLHEGCQPMGVVCGDFGVPLAYPQVSIILCNPSMQQRLLP